MFFFNSECWGKERGLLCLGWEGFSPSSPSSASRPPAPRTPPPASPLAHTPFCFFLHLCLLPLSLPAALIPVLGSQRVEPLQSGDGEQAPGGFLPPSPAQGQKWRACRGLALSSGDRRPQEDIHSGPGLLTLPPKGTGRKEPTTGPADRLLFSPQRAGGREAGTSRGVTGGSAPGKRVWEGGIYRLLFTKTRPVKDLTAAN